MKIFVIISFLLGVSCDANKNLSLLSTAFENVTNHLFQLETKMFIHNYGVDSRLITQLLLKSLNEKSMPFQLNNWTWKSGKVFMNTSALLTFKSLKNVRNFNNKLKLTNEFYKPIQLFVYCQNATITEIESLAQGIRKSMRQYYVRHYLQGKIYDLPQTTELTHGIQFEYFLIDQLEYLKLLTFVWYSPGNCGKFQLIEVNRFKKRTGKWESDKFSIEKLANFHGCEVIMHSLWPTMGSFFHMNIPEQLQTHLNYKLEFWSPEKNVFKEVDLVLWKGCFDAFDTGIMTLIGNTSSSKAQNIQDCFITSPVEFDPIRLAVPPAENYSEYEKLQMPFDNFVWALIAFTFIAAFTTIFIVNRIRRSVRNLVIGSNITTPSLNVVQIFFGIAQVNVPHKNFARFLAISFILYSLIIRTAWQGKMYEFMQKDISKPELQTIDEMIEKGYTFYMEPDFEKKFPESEIAKRGKLYTDDITGYDVISFKAYSNIFNREFRGVMQTDPRVMRLYSHETEGRFLQRVKKEVFYVTMCGMKIDRNHHFFGMFDLKSQQLSTGGIILHFQRDGLQCFDNTFASEANPYRHLPAEGPKVLTLKMLEPGFLIWLSSLSIAIMAFLLEWLATLKYFILFKSILLAFYLNRENIRRPISSQSINTIRPETGSNDSLEETEIKFDLNEGATENSIEIVKISVKALDRVDSIDNLVEACLKMNQGKVLVDF